MTAPLAHWAVAIAPVIALLLVFEWLDVFHLVGAREMAGALLLGTLASLSAWPVSGRLLDALPMGFSTYSRTAAPPIEEALKGAAIAWLFARNKVGFSLDAVIAGFAVGAGFSVVENAIYLTRFPELDLGVWLVRGLGTAIMHGAAAAVFAGAAQHWGERIARGPAVRWPPHPLHYLPGYLAATGIHLLFNHFPDRPQLAMLTTLVAVPLLVVLVMRVGTAEADAWLADEERDGAAAVATLDAGGWPDTPAGRRLAALAERLGSRAPPDAVRDLFATLTRTALRAEAALRARTAPTPADRALVARRRALERALGRTTLATLRPLLPFTRHQWWEIDAFAHRVGDHDG